MDSILDILDKVIEERGDISEYADGPRNYFGAIDKNIW